MKTMIYIIVLLLLEISLHFPYVEGALMNLPVKRILSPGIGIRYLSQLQAKIDARVISSPVLDFAPWLELHHIVLLQDKTNPRIACAIDFSPMDQTNPNTLSNLLLGKSVPAEIRINWIADFDGEIDSIKTLAISSSKLSSSKLNRFRYPPSTADETLIKFVDNIVSTWPTEMNFYIRNCQHFSDFVTRQLHDDLL